MTDNDFFKFPSTPHLALLGDTDVRNDKVLTEEECRDFLSHEIIIEEKLDGANLGISFDSAGNVRVQNRGEYVSLPGVGQWKKLAGWLDTKIDIFFDRLQDKYILFGEWCYAEHSVSYNRLPDWFLGFDIFDRQAQRFLSCRLRDELFQTLPVAQVPIIEQGRFSLHDLEKRMMRSCFGDQPAEGLYLRRDHNEFLVERAKLVRPAFVQAIEQHWSTSVIRPNGLRGFFPDGSAG